MSPSRPFILRPVATALLMAAMFLAGAVAFLQLPISALPEVDYPTMQVLTFYPGASPEVVASAVTAPLERQFGEVAGLSQMTSTSAGGVSVIVMQFQLSLSIDVAEQEVQAAINAAQSYLPANLPAPPVYSKSNPADAPVLTLAMTSNEMPLSQVEDLADTRLAPKISQISGVGLVSISGGQKPAVRIQANPTALASYGINLEDLRNALTGNSLNAAKGNFDGPAQDYTINANDQLTTSKDYRDVVVAYRNGAPVMLTSVAHIVDGVENAKLAAWNNFTPSVLMNIQRQPGANTITVVDSIQKLLPRLQNTLPKAVHVQVVSDRTTAIRASVKDVEFELMLTIGLVVMVIFLFLRSLSATIIPSIAVPLSLVGTFAVMYLCGFSLNNLTMMALTISTGFVVDDAIVMIENISRYIEMGETPMQAALLGAEQIGFTILSLTVSLIAVLIPLLFMGDVAGRLFRQFAVTLAVTIILSAFVSLTLTPMMSARILRYTPPEKQGRFYAWSERAFESIIAFYGRTLRFVLRFQTVTLLVAVGILVLTVFLYIVVPKGFFPTQDTGIIQGISQAAPSISFDAMTRSQQALVKVVLADPAVDSVSSFIGADGTNTTLNSGRIQINLKPLGARGVSATAVIQRLGPKLAQVPGIQLYMQPMQYLTVDDRVSRTEYQYTLEDPNQNELNTVVHELLPKFALAPISGLGNRPATGRRSGVPGNRPANRLSFWNHPGNHRQHALRCVRAAAGQYPLYRRQSVPRHSGGRTEVSAQSAEAERYLYSGFVDRRLVVCRAIEYRRFLLRRRSGPDCFGWERAADRDADKRGPGVNHIQLRAGGWCRQHARHIERHCDIGTLAGIQHQRQHHGAFGHQHLSQHLLECQHIDERDFAPGFREHSGSRVFRRRSRRWHREFRGRSRAADSRSVERSVAFRDEERVAVGQSPGAVSGGDHLIQSGGRLLAGAGAGCHERSDRQGEAAGQRGGELPGDGGGIREFAIERGSVDYSRPGNRLHRPRRTV